MAGTAASSASLLDQRFALDVQSVDALRRSAHVSPDEAAKVVAKQFEAIFMGMVLKSMREATPDSGLFGGKSTKMYQSMLDQQMAQHLSGRGGLHLADMLLAQLRRGMPHVDKAETQRADAAAAAPAPAQPRSNGMTPSAATPVSASTSRVIPASEGEPSAAAPSALTGPVHTPHANPIALAPLPAAGAPTRLAPGGSAGSPATSAGIGARVAEFVEKLGGAARDAAAATGVPEKLILAQAALESAWGRHEVRGDNGQASFNIFGVKADRAWRGPVVEATTTEVIEGVARRVKAKFRAYASYQEAFSDYAKFLTSNPRYGVVRNQHSVFGAASALQAAGYATDPQYADKLTRVLKRLLD